MKEKTIFGILDSGKYKGRKCIMQSLDSVIILVEKGKYFNGAEIYAHFDRMKDDFIPTPINN